jgi:histone-lysine N-methyltransferase SETMAR
MFEEEMQPAIHSRRREMLTNGVVLHHDNARPHKTAATAETIRKLKFELLPHTAYSSDLAPSDYHIFGPLKDALRGLRLENEDFAQLNVFLASGIRKPGDYVSK